ncbi:hypothetical protein MIR68_005383 [Amoeboaphelidium protococcarum]|nr:hypothetical protein MIR68_005383 [Amoeboaphelidium protococcarum]
MEVEQQTSNRGSLNKLNEQSAQGETANQSPHGPLQPRLSASIADLKQESANSVSEAIVQQQVSDALNGGDYLPGQDESLDPQLQQQQSFVDEQIDAVELTRRKVIAVQWLQQLLAQDNINLIPGGNLDDIDSILKLNLHDQLKSGALLCKALNILMTANPSFTAANLPPIEINERTDMFASLTNLNNFVRTSELYFNVDRFRLFDPIEVLQADGVSADSESRFIKAVYFLKLVVEETGLDFQVYSAKPFATLTFDQISQLVSMISTSPSNPVVAYDPRVVMSVQDTEAFQRLSSKLDAVETSHKSLSMLTFQIGSRFEQLQKDQEVIKKKLDNLVGGVLGAFDEVSHKLRDLKEVTDIVGNSALGLHSIVQLIENKNVQANSAILEALAKAQHVQAGQSTAFDDHKASTAYKSLLAEAKANGSASTESRKSSSNLAQSPSARISTSVPVSPSTPSPMLAQSPQQSSAAKVFKLPDEVLAMNLPKDELMRQSVLYEFIESEQDYVRDVNVMLEYHYKKLKFGRLLDDAQLKQMFSNLEELLPVNKKFLAQLNKRQSENCVISGIADLVLDVAPQFKVYDIYCANYQSALSLYKALKSRDDIKLYLEKSMNQPECRGLSLESFLIKPVQRICKYPLLLRELIKNTPKGHSDHQLLESAMQKIEEVLNSINEKTRAVVDREKLLELQSKIESALPLNLVVDGRRIIREGALQRVNNGKTKDRQFVLLNDYAIVFKTSGKQGTKLQYESHIELVRSLVNPNPNIKLAGGNNASGQKLIKLMFEIVSGSESYAFAAQSEQDRLRWMQMLEDAIRDAVDLSLPSLVQQLSPSPSTVGTAQSGGGGGASRNNSVKTVRTGTIRRKSNFFGLNNGNKRGSQESVAEFPEENSPALQSQASFGTSESKGRKKSIGSMIGNDLISEESSHKSADEISAQSSGNFRRISTASQMGVEGPQAVSIPVASPAAPQTVPLEVPGYPTWRAVDSGYGAFYYFNVETQITSWYHPQILAQQQQLSQQQPEQQQPQQQQSPEQQTEQPAVQQQPPVAIAFGSIGPPSSPPPQLLSSKEQQNGESVNDASQNKDQPETANVQATSSDNTQNQQEQ